MYKQLRWTERYIGRWTWTYKTILFFSVCFLKITLANPVHKHAIIVNKRPHITSWHLNVAGEELHLCHPVQKPRTRSPRHSSRASWLKLISPPENNKKLQWSTLKIEHYTNMQFAVCTALLLSCRYCPVEGSSNIALHTSARHCIPFLHPRVQNAGNILKRVATFIFEVNKNCHSFSYWT